MHLNTRKLLKPNLTLLILCTLTHLVPISQGGASTGQPQQDAQGQNVISSSNTSESNSDDDLVPTAFSNARANPTIAVSAPAATSPSSTTLPTATLAASSDSAPTTGSTTSFKPITEASTSTSTIPKTTASNQPVWITPSQQETLRATTTHSNNGTSQPPVNHLISNSSLSPNVHPLLIFSIRYEIRSFDLSASSLAKQYAHSNGNWAMLDQHFGQKHPQSKTLIAGLKNTIGLDFYYSSSESYIFWIDVMEERIFKGTMMNGVITNVNMIVQGGLVSAEGLAVDWIGQNIYWVESTLDHIEVANLNGLHRRTLIAGDMESPRAISVDPRFGLMFWTDWDKKSPRIERASMSGDDRRKLVDIKEVNGGWPNGLTLDYDALKIYWIDANSDSIHVVDYDGNNHRSLLRKIKSLGHPFAITLFDNNLYWTDWKTNFISTANKNDGSEPKEVLRQQSRLFDIKVHHPNRQPRIDDRLNPCANNGNCSHLCLLSKNGTRKCSCPHLMRLQQDEVTCETYERVLLIGRTHEIRAVDISKPLHHIMAPISVPKVFAPRQFEYDAKSRNIFWADSSTNEVKRAQLAGNNIETIIDVIIDTPSGLALDWISGNIYVTSAAPPKAGKIYVSNLNGEYISILMDGNQGISSPKSVVVHPIRGLLFCVDENVNSEPLIFMATMDGRNKRIIASKQYESSLANPSNLAMDLEKDRVYWVNQANSLSDRASIQYYDIGSDTVVTVYNEADLLPEQKFNPGVICVDGDYLIISSRAPNETIIRASKDNITDRVVYKTQSLDQILALRVYNASSQVGTNACSENNGGCSQLCVPTGPTTRACKCTMGYSVSPFNETQCVGKDLFLIFSFNLGMRGISLEPNSPADDYYLPPIHRAFRAFSIDYVYRDNLIYWVDNEEGSITRINRDTTNYQVIVQGLESEECIGIDWIAGNIYWLDPYYDIIEVARLNGTNRYVIISGDMDKANGIVVNAIKGYLVWSDIGTVPKIERARLDGSDRRVVVSFKLGHVDDITIDYMEDYIYWVDSSSSLIERIKVDGTGRQVMYNGQSNTQSLQHHLVSIAIYQNYLYVADSVHGQGSIVRIDKRNSSDFRYIQQNLGDSIRDIAIFAEQPLPTPAENPCVKDNGDCQDLCLFLGRPGKRRCICAHGKLNSDGLTCKPYDTFIMYSKLSQIDSLHIQEDESHNNSPYKPISIDSRSNIVSLTIDYPAQRVIYSEMTRDQICSVHFNGTGRRVLVDKQSFVEGVAYESNQLYWTSMQDNSISRLKTSSDGVLERTCNETGCTAAKVEKLVKLTPEDKPRGIAVDTCTKYVYWTNWNNEASIQRASPHNNYKVESIIKTNIKVPNGIAIDQRRRKLYWCDARLDKIETCDMDGMNRVVLIAALPQHPFALAVWKNYVFWTDWLARGVFKADKYTGQQAMQIKKVAQRLMGIAVASPDEHKCPVDHCGINNGGCAAGTICVSRETDDGQPNVSCKPDRGYSPIRPFEPRPGSCARGHTRCDGYHEIMMDNLERYKSLDSISANEPTGSANEPTLYLGSTSSPTTKINSPDPVEVTTPVKSANMSTPGTSSAVKPTLVEPPKTDSTSSTPTTTTTSTTTTAAATSVPIAVNITEASTSAVPLAPSQTHSSNTTQATPSSRYTTTVPPCHSTTTYIATMASTSTVTTTTTDGHDCATATDVTSSNHFKCYLSESVICIPMDKRCNGVHDCPSKEDESDCYLASKGQYILKQEENHWRKYVTVILVILAAAVAALFLVFGSRNKRRWFLGAHNGFSHRKMLEDNGTNIEISNPMFDEDDSANLVHCAFSIDLNERTTNFSNPLYERQVLLVSDKDPPSS